jgi:FMN-dependent NADH-azoreductase
MTHTVLKLDASARRDGSITRQLTDKITARLDADTLISRDLAETPVPQVTEAWLGASFTPEADRSPEQTKALALSENLIAEVERADTLVIGLPVYNFALPAALKAWVDQVARAGRTFHYTEDGPVGHLTGKRAIIAMASGGTEQGSGIDHATPYLRHILGFLGITDVTVIAADRLMLDGDASLEKAMAQIDQLDVHAKAA